MKNNWRGYLRKNKMAYLFLLPALLCLIGTVFIPICMAVKTSFFRDVFLSPLSQPFVGWDNYLSIFRDNLFWDSFWRSWYWTIGSVVLQFLVGFVAALVLNQQFVGRGIIRGLLIIPWVVPGTVTASIFSMLFTSTGLVNQLLIKMGLLDNFFPWLTNFGTAMPTLLLAHTWRGFPFYMIMMLAALQGIPDELYESAKIDGASALSCFLHITLPNIKGSIMVSTLLGVIWTYGYLDMIYIMTYGGPYYATYTQALYVYAKAFVKGDLGMASAGAVTLVLTMLLFSLLYLRSIRKSDIE
ncbi:MAG: sugar ABC transporter permease [Candidatus Atribacteria bacterium]|nr:sugar ABC transporter permease [Candidatus Atribacteria bacterium]